LHCAEEWVSLDSLYQLASILTHAAVDYCGISKTGNEGLNFKHKCSPD
jgi:hypothetical protein